MTSAEEVVTSTSAINSREKIRQLYFLFHVIFEKNDEFMLKSAVLLFATFTICCILDCKTNNEITLFDSSTHPSKTLVFVPDVCPASVPPGYARYSITRLSCLKDSPSNCFGLKGIFFWTPQLIRETSLAGFLR